MALTLEPLDAPAVSRRLLALDAVRGLAVLGMYIQHFSLNEWNAFVSGNTMILFMLCSGISYRLMFRSMEHKGWTSRKMRTRVLARALFIDITAYGILLLNGPFGVVLQAYAMLFLLMLPFRSCTVRQLTIFSAIGFLLCPVLTVSGLSLFSGNALFSDIAGGPLSGLAWAPVFLAGMAVADTDLHDRKTVLLLGAIGVAVLIPAKLLAVYVQPGIYRSVMAYLEAHIETLYPVVDEYAAWPRNVSTPMWNMLFVDTPNGGSTLELLIGTGGSLILLAAALLLEPFAKRPLRLFARLGKVSLSLYSLQFLFAWVAALFGGDVTMLLSGVPFSTLIVTLFVIAIGYALSLLPSGPLEAAIRKFEGLFC